MDYVKLFPGARADVAVRCSGRGAISLVAGEPGRRRRLGSSGSTSGASSILGLPLRRVLPPGGGPGGGGGGGGPGGDPAGRDGTVLEIDGVLLAVTVVSPAAGAVDDADLPDNVAVHRPCYLANTLKGSPDASFGISLGGGELVVNNEAFSSPTTYLNADTPFETGQLVQLNVEGISFHPFHIHVNPFQLQSKLSSYFQKGDWHDTVLQGDDAVKVRMYTDRFAGKIVVHCHILEHEDLGMMGLLNVGGVEGAVYAKAEDLDPLCYRDPAGRGFVEYSDAPADESLGMVAVLGIAVGAGVLLVAAVAWFKGARACGSGGGRSSGSGGSGGGDSAQGFEMKQTARMPGKNSGTAL